MTITDRDPGDEHQPAMDPIVRELVECLREAGMLLVSFDYADTWRKQITRYRKALAAAERAAKPASAPRHQHEWTTEVLPVRVRYKDCVSERPGIGGNWVAEYYATSPSTGQKCWMPWSCGTTILAAEIAKLAGLVVPKGGEGR